MSEQNLKTCTKCHAEKPRTIEHWHVDREKPDGYRPVCKACRSVLASKANSPAAKKLKRHERAVKKAQAILDDPKSSLSQVEKADRLLRLDKKRRDAILQPIIKEREDAERAKKLAETSPSLDRVRAQFYCNPFAQSHTDLVQMVVEMKVALVELVGPADEMAREYLTKLIGVVEEFITDTAATAKKKAEYEQEVIDGKACQSAADAIHDKFAGLFGEGVSTARKDQLKILFHIVRAEAQQQHKTIKPDEVTATGANRKKVSSRILEELHAMASRLGKAGTEVGAHQSLENAQSLDWQQHTSAQSMRAYVRQLTARLEEARATMSPEEYKKKYLELPVAPKEEIVIWKVRLLNGREEWIWPSGKIVRHGVDVGSAEIVKDARLGWTLAPSPVGAELDDETKPVGKMELIQEDDCSWHWVPEGSQGTYTQQSDGTWLRDAGNESPWSKPEPIVFKVGPAQPDAEHDAFRLGNWFTECEVAVAEHGPMLAEPPVILPPLKRTKADSIAVEPPPNAIQLERMNRPAETPWQRHERKRREEKDRETALLHGTYKWNFAE
jgi:hypothetical protein